MLRIILYLSWLLCTTAWADVTIEGTHYPGLSGGLDRQVIYLRENQMRIDQLAAPMPDGTNIASSLLIRFGGNPPGLLLIDHESKNVDVLSSLPPTGTAPDSTTGPAHVVEKDESRDILGYQAYRYDFSFSGNVDPLALLGQQLPPGMAGLVNIKLNVIGTSWVVPGMQGAAELAGFFTQLTGRQLAIGMVGSNPGAIGQELSLVSPELSRSFTGAMAQIARKGFPLLTQTNSSLEVDMEGFVADMIRGLLDSMGLAGEQTSETKVTRVITTPLTPERFYDGGLPAGYTQNGTW